MIYPITPQIKEDDNTLGYKTAEREREREVLFIRIFEKNFTVCHTHDFQKISLTITQDFLLRSMPQLYSNSTTYCHHFRAYKYTSFPIKLFNPS